MTIQALPYIVLLGTFAGMLLAFYKIKQFGATASAMTAYIIPVFAGIGGAILLNERITALMVVGMGFIMTGITLINYKRH